VDRQWADAGPEPDLLGAGRQLADQQLCRKCVLADPGLAIAEPVRCEQLELVVVVGVGDRASRPVMLREDPEIHAAVRVSEEDCEG